MSKRGSGRRKKSPDRTDPHHPDNLEENARLYLKNAEAFQRNYQERSMRQAYEKALEHGRASGTPDGLAIAAEAALCLGHIYKTRDLWGQALEYYKEAIELAKKSATSEGFYTGARAAWNLGNTYEEAEMDGLESAFREAINLGRASDKPEGLEVAAKAAFNLATNLGPDSVELERRMWQEAIELGKASGTKDGKHVVERATHYLTELMSDAKGDENPNEGA